MFLLINSLKSDTKFISLHILFYLKKKTFFFSSSSSSFLFPFRGVYNYTRFPLAFRRRRILWQSVQEYPVTNVEKGQGRRRITASLDESGGSPAVRPVRNINPIRGVN